MHAPAPARVAKSVDAAGLKIPRRKACRFESGPGHQRTAQHAASALPHPRRNPRMPPIPPVTKALMLIARRCSASTSCCGRWSMLFALWPLRQRRFLPWQVVTYAFLHGSIGHLFFNMLGPVDVRRRARAPLGPASATCSSAASVLAAALTQLLVDLRCSARATRRWAPRAPCSACCWPSA